MFDSVEDILLAASVPKRDEPSPRGRVTSMTDFTCIDVDVKRKCSSAING